MNTYLVTDHGVLSGSDKLQTTEFQKVLDLCKDNGGIVVVPRGEYHVSSLRMWSDTTLKLESGARLIGSVDCNDYEVFEFPEDVTSHSDMEMITGYYNDKPWKTYRRAIISAYGGKNIAIIGEPDSHIDGLDCFDPDGEEGYRGPHGIYLTNIDGITLSGYTIENCGNFSHQIDTSIKIKATNVTCLGGSDGFHLHCCDDMLIENCVFHTGDDCIGGINMTNLTVRNCEFNTSCDVFRAGGQHILVENCHIFGPGIYPHGLSIMEATGLAGKPELKNLSGHIDRNSGRHNTVCVWIHFASNEQPDKSPTEDVIFRNCKIDNVDKFLVYHADCCKIETGAYITGMTLENVTATNIQETSAIKAKEGSPLTVRLIDTTATDRSGKPIDLFPKELPDMTVISG